MGVVHNTAEKLFTFPQRLFHFLLLGNVDGYPKSDIFASRPFNGFVHAFVQAFVPMILKPSGVSFFKFFSEKVFVGAEGAWSI
jgi:hypothetical protein